MPGGVNGLTALSSHLLQRCQLQVAGLSYCLGGSVKSRERPPTAQLSDSYSPVEHLTATNTQ